MLPAISIRAKKENLPASTVKIKVIVPLSEWKKFEIQIVSHASQGLDISGFRPGKAPLDLIKNRLEDDKIAQEVLEKVLPLSYLEAIKKFDLRPIGSPKIQILQFEKDKDFIYTAECALWPKIQLPNYKKLKIQKPKISLNQEEIDRELELLKKRLTNFRPKKGKIEKGDRVQIDFVGKINQKTLPQLKRNNFWLIIDEQEVLPGFSKKLLGKKIGENLNFELRLPNVDSYQGLAGQRVFFSVKIKKIEKPLPITLEQIAKKLGHKDVKELKAKIKNFLVSQKEKEAENKWQSAILEKIAEHTKIEISPWLIAQEQERLIQQLSQDLALQGQNLEQFLLRIKKDKKEFEEQLKKQAEKNFVHSFILHEIAKKQGIKIKKSELKKAMEEQRTRLIHQGYKEEEIDRLLKDEGRQNQIITELKIARVMDFLKKLNK